MLRFTRPGSFLGAAAVALIVAGCAAQGGASNPPSSAPQGSSGPSASGTVYTVEVHQDAALGSFLVGEDGKSLYILTKDSAGKSTCSGSCASAWPPFLLETGETVAAGSGVTGTLSTIKRDDGTDQVALNGLPLYYFSGDSGPAGTAGQGVNGVWFLAAPGGGAVGGAAASPGASSAPTQDPKYNY